MISEDQIQAEIFKYYHNNYTIKGLGLMFAIPNGGSRNRIEAMKLKATGVFPGVSDLVVIMPNRNIIFVELKNAINGQSPKQKDFQKLVTKLGYDYCVIRSLEEFKTIVNENS